MLLEAVRIFADQLADVTNGVAAKLTGVPKDGSDSLTGVTIAITDETRDDEPARGRVPDGSTTIVISVRVSPQTTAQMDTSELRPVKVDHRIPLLISMRYLGEDSSTAVRNLYYVWRAVGRSIEALSQDLSAAARTRDQTVLVAIVQDDGVPLWASQDDKQVVLARQIVVQMRDTAPLS